MPQWAKLYGGILGWRQLISPGVVLPRIESSHNSVSPRTVLVGGAMPAPPAGLVVGLMAEVFFLRSSRCGLLVLLREVPALDQVRVIWLLAMHCSCS